MEMIPPSLKTSILGVFTLFLVLYFLFLRSKPSKSKAAKSHSPPEASGAWPIDGHLHLLRGSQPPHVTLGNLADEYGPAFTIRLGQYKALIVSQWDLAKEVFTTHDLLLLTRPESLVADLMSYDFAMFGFSPYGPYWREIRKLISLELLSTRRLEMLKHVRLSEIEMSTKELYNFWNEKTNVSASGKASLDFKDWFGNVTLNVVLKLVAGKRYFGGGVDGVEGIEARRTQKVMREFFHFIGLFLAADSIPILKYIDFGGNQRKMKKISKEMDKLVGEWLKEHRQKRESAGKATIDQKDFIDVMISLLEGAEIGANYNSDTIIKSTCIVWFPFKILRTFFIFNFSCETFIII